MESKRYRKSWRMTTETLPASETNDLFVYWENIFWSQSFQKSGKPGGIWTMWKINVTSEIFWTPQPIYDSIMTNI